jgi:hypothetical protein
MEMPYITGALALVLSAACAGFAQPPTRPCGPSATEVFHLRTECGALGEKIQNEQRQPFSDSLSYTKSYTAHYDPEANRCFVRIDAVSVTKDHAVVIDATLYDAQSHAVLAGYAVVHRSNGEPMTEVGQIGADTISGHAGYLKAKAFIDEHVREK